MTNSLIPVTVTVVVYAQKFEDRPILIITVIQALNLITPVHPSKGSRSIAVTRSPIVVLGKIVDWDLWQIRTCALRPTCDDHVAPSLDEDAALLKLMAAFHPASGRPSVSPRVSGLVSRGIGHVIWSCLATLRDLVTERMGQWGGTC